MSSRPNMVLVPKSIFNSYLQTVPRDVDNIIKEYVEIATRSMCDMSYSWQWDTYKEKTPDNPIRSSIKHEYINIRVMLETSCGRSAVEFRFSPDELSHLVENWPDDTMNPLNYLIYEWAHLANNKITNHHYDYLRINNEVIQIFSDINSAVIDSQNDYEDQ